MLDLGALKGFIDLGGVFILALVILWMYGGYLKTIDEKLTKVLALLAVLVKTQTNFNDIDKVVGQDGEAIAKLLTEAGEK